MVLLLLAACGAGPDEIAIAIKSENPVMREDGAKIAQNFDDEVVVEALVSVLGDASEQVRLNAIESIAELEATSAAPALVERLEGDTSPKVKRAAADAIGRLVAKDGMPALLAYLATFGADDREQLAAIWAIGHIGDEGGLDPEVKKSALVALVHVRDTTTDRYVRYNTNAALRTLK
ncbi:MAG: HEAT repeat domain-containing protein [Pseudomonadota bacterium]|nr:HEAT repeat domain-containing protein [Pseudomonadota bacterium]